MSNCSFAQRTSARRSGSIVASKAFWSRFAFVSCCRWRSAWIAPRVCSLIAGLVTTAERLADAEEQLQRFVRLQRPDDAGQHAEHACLGARRRELRWRRCWKEAPVAGAPLVGVGRAARARLEDGELSFEPVDRAVH